MILRILNITAKEKHLLQQCIIAIFEENLTVRILVLSKSLFSPWKQDQHPQLQRPGHLSGNIMTMSSMSSLLNTMTMLITSILEGTHPTPSRNLDKIQKNSSFISGPLLLLLWASCKCIIQELAEK